MATAPTNDPFAASGGGVWTGSGWLPKSNPKSAQYAPATATPAAGATPSASAPTSIGQASTAAQTYSATPGAQPPSQSTTNQGTQDVVRNSYLQRATQTPSVDTNDPVYRQQADTFAAAEERSRRNANADNAESMNARMLGGSGAQGVVERANNEQASQDSASFESQLAYKELTNKRAEIADALQNLGGMMSADQQRALQKQLADLDAQLKRESLSVQSQLGNADIALRDKLGMGGLNIDMLRTLLGNQQANNSLGAQIGLSQAQLNQQALLALMNGGGG